MEKDTCFKKDIIEVIGENRYIPTSHNCFIKSISSLTGKEYRQHFLQFIRNQRRRKYLMTQARIQPFCKANVFNIGYYSGKELS